jgi:hypothetical protein
MMVGCGGGTPGGSHDGGTGGGGGSGGGAAVGSGGNTQGGSGGGGGMSGSGGAPGDAAAGTGGNSGTGGAPIDVAAATGGSSGTGGTPSDAAGTQDGRAETAETAGTCTAAFNPTACVACCDALYPGAFDQAFFGNECLYCTATCRDTRICTGVAGGSAKPIDGPCLRCMQPYIESSDCRATGGPKCQGFLECLKQCPVN